MSLWGLGAVSACSQAPEASLPRDAVAVVSAFVDEPGVYKTADRWRFDGGIEITDVRIEGARASLGDTIRVSMHARGVRGEVDMVVSVQPPRAASRQVALGGVDAPPPTLPPDPRQVSVDRRMAVAAGRRTIQLELPTPWHPSHAIVTLALSSAGRPILARSGPRSDAGVAMLGLLPVQARPTVVVAPRAAVAPSVDADLGDAVWQGPATTLVESLDGEPWKGRAGEVRFSWDDTFLYAAAAIYDGDVWSTMLEHDDPLWKEEVFELFIFGQAPAHRYLELQVSPRGVTFDARFDGHRKADTQWSSAWRTAVDVRGTLDNRRDVDEGWTAEVAVPWTEICAWTAAPCPPVVGAELRINAFRFERPRGGGTVGLALSPTRVPDFHAADNAAVLVLGS